MGTGTTNPLYVDRGPASVSDGRLQDLEPGAVGLNRFEELAERVRAGDLDHVLATLDSYSKYQVDRAPLLHELANLVAGSLRDRFLGEEGASDENLGLLRRWEERMERPLPHMAEIISFEREQAGDLDRLDGQRALVAHYITPASERLPERGTAKALLIAMCCEQVKLHHAVVRAAWMDDFDRLRFIGLDSYSADEHAELFGRVNDRLGGAMATLMEEKLLTGQELPDDTEDQLRAALPVAFVVHMSETFTNDPQKLDEALRKIMGKKAYLRCRRSVAGATNWRARRRVRRRGFGRMLVETKTAIPAIVIGITRAHQEYKQRTDQTADDYARYRDLISDSLRGLLVDVAIDYEDHGDSIEFQRHSYQLTF